MSLPEDMVREVLARVKDEGDLFTCAGTCRRWSFLAADVRRRRWPYHPSSFLSGFLIAKSSARSLFPMPASVFGRDRRLLRSFFHDAVGSLLKRATPLAARHGLLLMRLPSSRALLQLAVCNLLVGTCDVLPPLESGWRYHDSGYAIFTKADCSSTGKQQPSSSSPRGYSALFKVLVICGNRDHQPFTLHAFSYCDGTWNTPTETVFDPTKLGICGPLMHRNAVVCHGTAHWLVGWDHLCPSDSRLHTIDVDAKTSQVSLTKIVSPIRQNLHIYDEPQLSVSANGILSLIYMERPGNNWQGFQLEICTRKDDERSEGDGPVTWLYSRVVELKPPNQIQAERLHLTFLGEKGGTVVVRDNYMNFYIADLETGVMEKLKYHGHVSRQMFIPFEIYWPTF
uniref:F-box domain-containing protein n=1 Tax=Hordeum vulgare subsp. vulgare TaxID=112509 RepID=A0A8I6Z0N6_HORVV